MNEPIIYDYDARKLPREYHEAIGRVTSCWASTEGIIEWAIAGFMGVDVEFGWATTTHMSGPLRFSVLLSAAEIRFDDEANLNAIDDLVDGLKSAAELRNKHAHQIWKLHPDGRVFRESISSRSGVDLTSEPVVVDEIFRDAEVIYASGIALMDFLIGTGTVPPLPPGNRAREHATKPARRERRRAYRESKKGHG